MKFEGLLIILFILSWISGLLSVLTGLIQFKKFRSAVIKFLPSIKTSLLPTGDVPPAFLLQWGKRVGMLLLCFGTGSQAERYLQLFTDTAAIRQYENPEVNRYLNRTLFCMSWFAGSISVGILCLELLLTTVIDL